MAGAISIYHLLWYFVLYSVLGWCLEVIFCSVNTGKFVNRGFLNGPLCPIYGFGGVILTTLLEPVDNIFLLYISAVVLCSALELVAGFLLKKVFHTTWWDYSDEPLNLGGYICLKFCLLWGIAGIILMDGVHPLVRMLVGLIPGVLGWVLLGVLYAGILLDLAITVVAISKFNRDLREMERLTKALRAGSDKMAQTLGGAAILVAGRVEALDLPAKKEALAKRAQAARERLPLPDGQALQARLEQLTERSTRVRNRLEKAFPNMKNTRYSDAFSAWRRRRRNGGTSDESESTE